MQSGMQFDNCPGLCLLLLMFLDMLGTPAASCSAGQYAHTGSTPPGSCHACPPGRFQQLNHSDATECTRCPPGRTAVCANASSCDQCGANYQSNTQRTECMFPARDFKADIRVDSRRQLCVSTDTSRLDVDGIQLLFELEQQGQGCVYTFDLFACKPTCNNVTRALVRNETNGLTSLIEYSSLISLNASEGTTTSVCIVGQKLDIRAQVLKRLELRHARRNGNGIILGNFTWRAPRWRIQSECDNLHYLDDYTSPNPHDWKCVACPLHANCSSAATWLDVRPLGGFVRLDENDTDASCSSFPARETTNSTPKLKLDKFVP